jgi:dihydroorotate dehydrogenase
MYSRIFRSLLFKFDPEIIHTLTVQALRFVGSNLLLKKMIWKYFDAYRYKTAPVDAFGIKFPNPVGLAAGYDKDGFAWRGLEVLGFGHVEIGTVTPKAQIGNPKPRIFRCIEERAIINRMGFPGKGSDYVHSRMSKSNISLSNMIKGINIGKNKDTPNEEAYQDYITLLKRFSSIADYLVVNVSSPNTIGLRKLQTRVYLEDLLSKMYSVRATMKVQPPILVKISPDLSNDQLDDVLEAVVRTGMDGIIATNTTIKRFPMKSNLGKEAGGLSGAPLSEVSRRMVSEIYQRTEGKLPIIGVGGIMSPGDAKSMLDAGAILIQIYSGLIYGGPTLVRDILKSL